MKLCINQRALRAVLCVVPCVWFSLCLPFPPESPVLAYTVELARRVGTLCARYSFLLISVFCSTFQLELKSARAVVQRHGIMTTCTCLSCLVFNISEFLVEKVSFCREGWEDEGGWKMVREGERVWGCVSVSEGEGVRRRAGEGERGCGSVGVWFSSCNLVVVSQKLFNFRFSSWCLSFCMFLLLLSVLINVLSKGVFSQNRFGEHAI